MYSIGKWLQRWKDLLYGDGELMDGFCLLPSPLYEQLDTAHALLPNTTEFCIVLQ